MSKLTVKEFADIHGVSVQSVYKKMKEFKIEWREIKGTKYIIIKDEINYEEKLNQLQLKYDSLKDRYEVLKDMIKLLKKESQRYYNLLPKPKKKKKKNKKN